MIALYSKNNTSCKQSFSFLRQPMYTDVVIVITNLRRVITNWESNGFRRMKSSAIIKSAWRYASFLLLFQRGADRRSRPWFIYHRRWQVSFLAAVNDVSSIASSTGGKGKLLFVPRSFVVLRDERNKDYAARNEERYLKNKSEWKA